MVGIGIDLVDIERFLHLECLRRVAEYILTENEQGELEASYDQVRFLSSCFAIKEAVIKAAPKCLTYHDVIVSKNGLKPAAVVACLPDVTFHISLTHTHTQVAAIAIAE